MEGELSIQSMVISHLALKRVGDFRKTERQIEQEQSKVEVDREGFV